MQPDFDAVSHDMKSEVMEFPAAGQLSNKYDLFIKNRICGYIFNSSFFDMRNEEAVNFDLINEEIMLELNDKYEEIFREMYGNWPIPGSTSLNPYTLCDVTVNDEVFKEHVFICLTRKRGSKPNCIVQYFVSPIYGWLISRHLINGRFIFTRNDKKELVVFALAEEPAIENLLVIENTHMAYYSARKYQQKGMHLYSVFSDDGRDSLT